MMTRISHSSVYKALSIFMIWGLAALFYFYENLLQVLPNVIKPKLSESFNLNGAEFGELTAVCFYAYGLMQIPVGIFSDRFKPKYMLSVACFVCALGCFVFAVANTLLIAKIGRILMGLGGSFAFICTAKLATQYFSVRWHAFFLGLTVTIGFLGSAVSLSFISQLTDNYNWHSIVQSSGLFGLALAFVLFIFVPHSSNFSKKTEKKMHTSYNKIFKQTEIWILAFYGCLMFVPTQVFGASWGISFLCEAHGFEHAAAGNTMALIYGGWVIGAPLWGWLSSRHQNPYFILKNATIVTFLICLVLVFYNPLTANSFGFLLFGLGLFSSAYLLIFSIIQSNVPQQFSGTAFGIVNAMTSFSALTDPLVGKILDNVALDYQAALLIIPVVTFLALCLLFFILSKAYFSRNLVPA